MSRGLRLGLVALVVGLGLVGCASDGQKSSSASKKGGGYASAETQGMGSGSSFAEQDQWGNSQSQADLMAKRTFHFGYDRYDVDNAEYAAIEAHADYLASHPNKTVRIEGHTDERGSREYNVALGERRAKSVTDVMMSRGVEPRQIKVVSYGEEKPAARGSNESAYQENRRAVIVYEE